MTELRIETLTLPGARLGAENPLPFFRDPAVNSVFQAAPSLPAEMRAGLGRETAFRVLPYRMQDAYSRRREPLEFRAVVLENETLRATFLPELGGRLVSLFYQPLARELLHRNPVFQPANLAIRNAWFSGGIEWNVGQFGHTFTTCAPLFAAAIEDASGAPGLRLYEYERVHGLFWQIDFYLPPGLPFLAAYTRVINPAPRPTVMYWWTNVAVNETPDVRVLAPAGQAIYVDFGGREPVFGCTCLPGLPSLRGADGTYALNSTFANEFFFQCEGAAMPWEAALDGQGRGFVEASTGRLKYRKLFCWGSHAGGRRWQEFLSQPGQAYLEIQAGLAPTQVHGLEMPPHAAWDWTQVFGFVEADPARVHGADWPAAWGAVDEALKASITPRQLNELEVECRERAGLPGKTLLQRGAGWGALELARRARQPEATQRPVGAVLPAAAARSTGAPTVGAQAGSLGITLPAGVEPPRPASPEQTADAVDAAPSVTAEPSADKARPVDLPGRVAAGCSAPQRPAPGALPASFAFAPETLGPEQAPWLALLERGSFPDAAPEDLPGAWMVQKEWQELLEANLAGPARRGWLALLHLGVMRLEALDEAGAAEAWQESLRAQPSLWAHRNLAVLRLRQKEVALALAHYEQAWQLALQTPGQSDALLTALAVEYLQALLKAGQYARGQAVFDALPPRARDADRVQMLRGQIALGLGDLAGVEQVLRREYAVVREGETLLTDLWFELQARARALESGQALTPQLRQAVKAGCTPPARIDFRGFDGH